tara:strand:- start:329 stop:523 length:195 start_codon:yes stop_codon:yes gene_type:complete
MSNMKVKYQYGYGEPVYITVEHIRDGGDCLHLISDDSDDEIYLADNLTWCGKEQCYLASISENA